MAPVVRVVPFGDGYGVVSAVTPFHPEDHTWPDQPADVGTLTLGGRTSQVVDCVIGAAPRGAAGALSIGSDVPVRRGDPGWDWYVVHLTPDDPGPAVGEAVELAVDPAHRHGLSAGHTACELVGLALNQVLAARWSKEVKPDALGAPDFDKLAITRSRITARVSVDHYRLGKSLRRKGFSAVGLADELPEAEAAVNALMAGWIAEDAPTGVRTDGPTVADPRYFCCGLRQGAVTTPCGGTHVERTGELGRVSVTLELSEDGTELRMEAKGT
ncbi:metal-dependent hydrolase [Streptomyces tendae]|uniref:metal-dependent hydrolase n=1 Tax=Streptomyces tendae TaxID=1932 RepID=UPI002491DB36|nr:metal-dependent hydrolase [Streptomyces tendae]